MLKPFSMDRRTFLGATTFLLSSFPSNDRLFADSPNDVILRFAVMSDIHFPANPEAEEVKRFDRALQFMYEWSKKQPYSSFDALLVAGDVSNHGIADEINIFKSHLDSGIHEGTQKILCMGNHEFYGGDKKLWQKTFELTPNDHYKMNGYHVIALSPERGSCQDGDYLYAIDWLKTELDAAVADTPDRPIFMIQHYHITPTVYGSRDEDNWGTKDLFDLLQQYPQVVNFSGHSHYPINDPRSAWQGQFSAFGTGTLSYFEMSGGRYEKFPAGFHDAAQFYVVEVHRDHSVVLKPYDLITDSFFEQIYTITTPGNVSKYTYTDARYQTAPLPTWTSDAKLKCVEESYGGGTFLIPQANGDPIVHSYHLNFEKPSKKDDLQTSWIPEGDQYLWSQYFFRNPPNPLEVTVDHLDELTDYRMTVAALNAFGKESVQKKTISFRTKKDPNETVDRNAKKPDANLLNIIFKEGKPINVAVNAYPSQKPVEIHGEPKIEMDSVLGKEVAIFDGVDDFLKIAFTAEEYRRMTRQITIAVQFQIEKFEKTGNWDVFANTENGGYAFEIHHGKKTLDFWICINGQYTILSTPFTAGKYHTAYGVYNGSNVLLYIDGQKASEKAITGGITYTSNEKSRAFCIGSDIHSDGGGSGFFKGRVAEARLYRWALTDQQIANLS